MRKNSARIETIQISLCIDDAGKRERGEHVGKGRGNLAIADFLMNYVDEVVGNSPELVIFEDKILARLHQIEHIGDNSNFISTAA